MTFLGIVLILAGVSFMFAAPLLGLIFIALGAVVIAKGKNTKVQEEEVKVTRKKLEDKDIWVAKRVDELINKEEYSPSDAKVKAESEYIILKQKEEAEDVYLKTIGFIKSQEYYKPQDFLFASWTEDATELISPNYYKVTVTYLDASGEQLSMDYYVYKENPKKGWKISKKPIK